MKYKTQIKRRGIARDKLEIAAQRMAACFADREAADERYRDAKNLFYSAIKVFEAETAKINALVAKASIKKLSPSKK